MNMVVNSTIVGVDQRVDPHPSNDHWPSFDKRIWQRNYYEHIIRNQRELTKIQKYITGNAKMWERDKNYLK